MSTSLVHVLTVIGKAAQDLESTCEELLGRRIARSSASYGSLDWTERDHEDLAQLCKRLIGAAHNLPVLYYAQYLDPWTVADSRFRLVRWPDDKRRQIYSADFGLAFYPLRFSSHFLADIERVRETIAYRTQQEDRWYVDRLKEAIEAAAWLQKPSLVVCIGECTGPSRLDDEVKASLTAPITS